MVVIIYCLCVKSYTGFGGGHSGGYEGHDGGLKQVGLKRVEHKSVGHKRVGYEPVGHKRVNMLVV